ncbi:tetratricopeptide repeat protein [Kaarinaea lacus]
MVRLVKRVVLVIAALQLIGCSALSSKPGEPASQEPQEATQESGIEMHEGVLQPFEEEAAASAALDIPDFPTDISPQMLYQLMVAEIAFQRGQMDVAVANYLDAAKETNDPKVSERATQLAIYAQDMGAALTAASQWVELDEENPDTHRTYAAILLKIGRAADAVNEYERMIQLMPPEDAPKAYSMIVSQLSREQNHALALSVMEKLVENRKDDPDAMFAYAHLAMRHAQFDTALATLDELLVSNPDWSKAIILRARILAMQGGREQALDYLAGILKKDSMAKNVEVGITYARMLTEARQLDEALTQFIRLTEIAPKNEELHYFSGVLALQLKKTNVARKHLEKVVKLDRERSFEANYYLGQVAELEEDYKEAIIRYASVRRGELYFNAQIRVVALLSQQKQFQQARDHLKSIRPMNDQQQIQLYLLEGDVLREANRYDDAKQFYSNILDSHPEETTIRYARALIAEKLGELDLLESDLRTILQTEPENAQVLNALGYTLADRTERYEEALQYIQKALELQPNDAAVMDSMGWVKYRLGDYEAAVAHLRKANELARDPEIAAHLGEVLWVMGKKNDALKIWEESLKENPEHEVLLKTMKRFGL